jgi:hypothetical protein
MGWFFLAVIGLSAWALTWEAFRRGRLRTPWHRDVAALLLLALATLGCFWRVAVGQNWMPADGGDLVSFLFPTYRFAATSLAAGAWPLWNPSLYGGAPHVGDIQAGLLYPPNFILFLLKPDFPYSALQWLSMAHIWFAGAGLYLYLARGAHLRRVAALAGALVFMFSDAFFVHFGNLNFNAVMSWLPWVFWAYTANSRHTDDPATQRPLLARYSSLIAHHASGAVIAGLLLAVATLAGHIQATLFIGLALIIYSALRLWLHREDPLLRQRAIAALISLCTCLLVTFLFTAPILLPGLELAARTARVNWNYQQTAGYSLSPAQWIGWLIPGFFGRGPQFHWGLWPRVEAGYLGILPLILAGLAVTLRRDRRTWLWFGMAAASFVLALGVYALPHGWLTLLPGFGQLRAPARLVLVTGFAIAILAAIGLDAALRPFDERGRAAFARAWRLVGGATAAGWAIAVPLTNQALLLTQDREPAIISHVSVALIAVVSAAGLLSASFLWLTARRGEWARSITLGWLAAGLILLDVASLAAYQDLGDRDPSLGYHQPAISAFLKQQPGPFRIDTKTGIEREWQQNTALLDGLEDVGGVANPLLLADAGRYWDNLGSRSTPLYDLLNVRYVIVRKDAPLDWSKFVLAFSGDEKLNVYENKNVLPRAFLVPQVQVVGDHEAAWSAIHAPGFDPRVTAIVEGASDQQVGGQGQVSDLQTAPNRLSMQVSADAPAFLLVSQMWYPGWQVWLDGRPHAAAVLTDYTFQGVFLPAGTHQVELRFEPTSWRAGWLLAGIGLLGLIVFAVIRGSARRSANRVAERG